MGRIRPPGQLPHKEPSVPGLSLLLCPSLPRRERELCLVRQRGQQQQRALSHPQRTGAPRLKENSWEKKKKTKLVFFSSAVSRIISFHHS